MVASKNCCMLSSFSWRRDDAKGIDDALESFSATIFSLWNAIYYFVFFSRERYTIPIRTFLVYFSRFLFLPFPFFEFLLLSIIQHIGKICVIHAIRRLRQVPPASLYLSVDEICWFYYEISPFHQAASSVRLRRSQFICQCVHVVNGSIVEASPRSAEAAYPQRRRGCRAVWGGNQADTAGKPSISSLSALRKRVPRVFQYLLTRL